MQHKIHQVQDTCVTELYLFLSIIIAMGVHVLPSVADFWSTDSLLGVPWISAGMPIDCFKALLNCFHVNDNSKAVLCNQPVSSSAEDGHP